MTNLFMSSVSQSIQIKVLNENNFHLKRDGTFPGGNVEIPSFIAQKGDEVVLNCPVNTAGEIITFQTLKYI